jgi:hypothetical protein
MRRCQRYYDRILRKVGEDIWRSLVEEDGSDTGGDNVRRNDDTGAAGIG